jgi:hypothetical protein
MTIVNDDVHDDNEDDFQRLQRSVVLLHVQIYIPVYHQLLSIGAAPFLSSRGWSMRLVFHWMHLSSLREEASRRALS